MFDEFVGAWRRSGLAVGGHRAVDHCDVLWLQTPEWFADMRVRIDASAPVGGREVPEWMNENRAFAGQATWRSGVMTWQHRFDSLPGPDVDSSPLSWENGVLVERGVTTLDGREVSFEEEWLRMTPDGIPWATAHSDTEVRVEVGPWAVEIRDHRPEGGFSAVRYHRIGTVWTAVSFL